MVRGGPGKPGVGERTDGRRSAFADTHQFDEQAERPQGVGSNGLAEEERLEYVSFFWSGCFFDYLAYDDALPRLAGSNLFQRLNQGHFAKILAGELSPTGVAFQSLLRTRP